MPAITPTPSTQPAAAAGGIAGHARYLGAQIAADLGRKMVLLGGPRQVGKTRLGMALPQRVGKPLSINALREDLQVAHATLARWLDVLERLYAFFRIAPFGATLLRAVRKERKHYHYDWTVVESLPARFENLVASHLLKWADYQTDTQGRGIELRYFRDIDGREVDFVVTDHSATPLAFVECKWGDEPAAPALRYLRQRFSAVPAWQISAVGTRDFITPDGIRVAPATVLLRELA